MVVVKKAILSSIAKVLAGFSSLIAILWRWMAVNPSVMSLQSWTEWAD